MTCYWRGRHEPATATVVFELPHILAGEQRSYCGSHGRRAAMAEGASISVVVARAVG
jgi:hypothetical protein